MSTRLSGSLLLLIALVLSLNVGEFAAQDPPQTTPAAATAQQPDLSGTYTGTFNCEGAGLMGDTTLTITGNQFTTADGKTGRIVTSKSGGYTAVAFQVGEMMTGTTAATGTAPTPPQIFSMRARKVGNRLILTPAPGTTMKCSFTPARAMARGRRNQRTPAATGTEVAAPATAPTTPATPTPTTTPAPETPMPSPTPPPSPSPTATPTPEPSPEPNPSPAPSPTPEPNPSPMPSPSASPTASPTPSPTPTPSPRG